MTPSEKRATEIGTQAGREVLLHRVVTTYNQYEFFPYVADAPQMPAIEIDEARMWAHCPDTKDCTPTQARCIREAYEQTVRTRFSAQAKAGCWGMAAKVISGGAC
jgi:hypothetical protein